MQLLRHFRSLKKATGLKNLSTTHPPYQPPLAAPRCESCAIFACLSYKISGLLTTHPSSLAQLGSPNFVSIIWASLDLCSYWVIAYGQALWLSYIYINLPLPHLRCPFLPFFLLPSSPCCSLCPAAHLSADSIAVGTSEASPNLQ